MVKNSDNEFIHNIRTSLSTIHAGIAGIKDYLPILLESYYQAEKADLIAGKIRPQQLIALSCTLEHTLAALQQASTYVDNFSLNLQSINQELDESTKSF